MRILFYIDPNVISSGTSEPKNNVERSRYSPTRIATT